MPLLHDVNRAALLTLRAVKRGIGSLIEQCHIVARPVLGDAGAEPNADVPMLAARDWRVQLVGANAM